MGRGGFQRIPNSTLGESTDDIPLSTSKALDGDLEAGLGTQSDEAVTPFEQLVRSCPPRNADKATVGAWLAQGFSGVEGLDIRGDDFDSLEWDGAELHKSRTFPEFGSKVIAVALRQTRSGIHSDVVEEIYKAAEEYRRRNGDTDPKPDLLVWIFEKFFFSVGVLLALAAIAFGIFVVGGVLITVVQAAWNMLKTVFVFLLGAWRFHLSESQNEPPNPVSGT